MSDTLTDALNAPAGRLAEILIKALAKAERGKELSNPLRERLGKLFDAKGTFGKLARVRLAAEASFLFDRVPEWTIEKVLPLFDWSSSEAQAAWSARRYSNYIGSPKLIELTKKPFLELFARPDVSDEDRAIFADWLAAMALANLRSEAAYPISSAEARSALRQAGARAISSFGHRLAIEMQRANADEKISRWRDAVGPVFTSVWPLDVELQTTESAGTLVQLLLATGSAFPEAAEAVLPFIRSDDARHASGVFSISEADDALYMSSPEKMLELLAAVVGDLQPRNSFGFRKSLDRLRSHAPELVDSKKFQKLLSFASKV
jgi:hypothetical protein